MQYNYSLTIKLASSNTVLAYLKHVVINRDKHREAVGHVQQALSISLPRENAVGDILYQWLGGDVGRDEGLLACCLALSSTCRLGKLCAVYT